MTDLLILKLILKTLHLLIIYVSSTHELLVDCKANNIQIGSSYLRYEYLSNNIVFLNEDSNNLLINYFNTELLQALKNGLQIRKVYITLPKYGRSIIQLIFSDDI